MDGSEAWRRRSGCGHRRFQKAASRCRHPVGSDPSLTVLPITSDLRDAPAFRVDLPSDALTGLRVPSQVMVDKILTVRREKVGNVIGRIDESRMWSIDRALMVFLGIA